MGKEQRLFGYSPSELRHISRADMRDRLEEIYDRLEDVLVELNDLVKHIHPHGLIQRNELRDARGQLMSSRAGLARAIESLTT